MRKTMNKGKNICDRLKSIRKHIADENNIAYTPHECKYTGHCKGTCPVCEAETRWLEQQLSTRKAAGLPLKIAGVALALCATSVSLAQVEANNTENCQSDTLKTVDLSHGSTDTVKITGIVLYEDNKPLTGAMINIINYKNEKTHGALTNINGEFSIIVPRNSEIEFEYIGCKNKTLKTNELQENSKVILEQDSQGLQGEIIVIDNKVDDVYNRKH